jgi:hypothetical protein
VCIIFWSLSFFSSLSLNKNSLPCVILLRRLLYLTIDCGSHFIFLNRLTLGLDNVVFFFPPLSFPMSFPCGLWLANRDSVFFSFLFYFISDALSLLLVYHCLLYIMTAQGNISLDSVMIRLFYKTITNFSESSINSSFVRPPDM